MRPERAGTASYPPQSERGSTRRCTADDAALFRPTNARGCVERKRPKAVIRHPRARACLAAFTFIMGHEGLRP